MQFPGFPNANGDKITVQLADGRTTIKGVIKSQNTDHIHLTELDEDRADVLVSKKHVALIEAVPPPAKK